MRVIRKRGKSEPLVPVLRPIMLRLNHHRDRSHLLGDGRFDPEESGKFARLGELCEEIASRQEKLNQA